MIVEEAENKGIDISGVSRNVQAIRDHIDLVEGFVLDEEPEEEIPIITPKIRKKKVRITPSIGTDPQKSPSRLSKLAAMASSKDLTDIENFCTSKFDLEKK